MNDNLSIFKEIATTLGKLPSRGEFVDAMKAAMDLIAKAELKLLAKIDGKIKETDNETQRMVNAMGEMRGQFQQAIKETKSANENTFAQIKLRAMTAMQEMFSKMDVAGKMDAMYSEHEAMMKECEAKMPDTEKMMKEMEKEMMDKMPPETGETIVDKINEADGKIHRERVEGLDDEIKALRKELATKSSGRGGGTSAVGVAHAFKYIAHTEAPVGDIDGVNKTYTVKNNIWWIAGFTLSGEQVAELPNFTYANHTITFATAIPAVYSGKDFECKYIGT